ncbi:hypothetical protein PIB30_100014 [Stylosanthes scabra]|uniref:Uncharacterized protein n=1 Tax=Stylosanthes scabra TaxID=79078 RepID=A0ABU6VWZ4_9FABA|nr:hypothetical protein [Stylosanthes scabra]
MMCCHQFLENQFGLKPIGRPKYKKKSGVDEQPPSGAGLSREGQAQKCSYYFARGHNKRTCPKKHKVEAPSAENNAMRPRRKASAKASKTSIAISTSNKLSQQGSSKTCGGQNMLNGANTQAKRKSIVSTQQSQVTSKRGKISPSKSAPAQALTLPKVLPTPCVATKPILSTQRRGSPRICVVGHQAHVPGHVYTTSNVTFTSPSLTHPRIGVEDPRICVESTLAASNITRPTPKSFMRGSKLHKTHAWAWKSTHMRGKLTQVTFEAHVWKKLNVTPFQSHAYVQNSTHMRGRQAPFPSFSRLTYMR